MQIVYIAMFSVEREGDTFIGVYTTMEAAQQSYDVKRRLPASPEWVSSSAGRCIANAGYGCKVVIDSHLVTDK